MSRGAKPTKAKRAKAKIAADRAGRRKPLKTEASGRHQLEQRLAEALEQQTATAEILRVIRRSPTDVQPVFDAIVASAARLCEAEFSAVARFEDGLLHLVAISNMSAAETEAYRSLFPRPPHRNFIIGRVFLDARPVHVEDVLLDPDYDPRTLEVLERAATFRSYLGIPIVRNGVPIGAIGCGRREVKPFTWAQIELVQIFADQAVIAIENARLFTELQEKNRAVTQSHAQMTEALGQQTATADILRAISSSPTDVRPVFDMIARSARRLCEADSGAVFTYDGEMLHLESLDNVGFHGADALRSAYPMPASPAHASGRVILEGHPVHIPDVQADRNYDLRAALGAGLRSVLAVPMLRGGTAIGTIVLYAWAIPRPFSDKQIALLQTFADQAVIAIENVRMFNELEARNRDLTETLEQQTATGEILRAISSSPTDAQPVFDVIAESARRLCEGQFCQVFRLDAGSLHFVAYHGHSREGVEATRRAFPAPSDRGTAAGRAILSAAVVQIPDVEADPEYAMGAVARAVRFRSLVAVPMMREGVPIGAIAVARSGPGPFPDRQIDLLKTFADQAVIAIQNVRLFTQVQEQNRELIDALEQQTAMGDILRVISSSPTDVQPMLDTVAESAARLCESFDAAIWRRDDDRLLLVAHHGPIPVGRIGEFSLPLIRGTVAGRSVVDARTVHVADAQSEVGEFPESSENARRMGFRTILSAPLMREGVAIGSIQIRRTDAQLFAGRQVVLLETFADQAVIAIENVRLFKELEARNRELTETLEQQTATGEILRVISSSPTDVQPVFDTIAQSAARLCAAADAHIWQREGDRLRVVASLGALPMTRRELTISRQSVVGRAVNDCRAVHVEDLAEAFHEEFPDSWGMMSIGYRTILAMPLVREGEPIGVIMIRRTEVRPFSSGQVALLKTFADQAVIAIENVRLFKELETRNHDLGESLEQQTATSEILRVISSSPTDVQPVLDAVTESAARLCESLDSAIWRRDGDRCLLVAHNGGIPIGPIGEFSLPLVRGTIPGRSVLDGQTIHVADAPTEVDEFPESSENARRMGFRTILNVPLMREGVAIGVISLRRTEVQLFTERQVALLETFADQAVIAIENVRLFQELQTRTRDLTQSVGELRALGEVSQAVGSTLDLETVLATIVSRAVQLSGSDQGLVYEFDEATQTFQQRATHQITPEYVEALREAPIRLGEGAMGRAGVIREPVQVADIHAEWQLVAPQVRAFLDREGVRSLLAMPLVREERLLGGLVILRTEPGAFSPEVVATLQAFAAQSVLAIHNARLFREIQRQKQYSDALVETSPVAIATMDLRGMVVGWNPGAERLFGYSPGEALGREVDDLVATPEIREEVRENLRQMHSGQRVRGITRRARKDGTLVDVEVSSMPVVVDGAEVGSIAIYHDITELLQARREAEAANEAKSAFLATMSHEIRTPLNAVIGMSGLLLNTALSDEQREYAEIVRQSGDALLTVINDILDFSKIEAGRLDLESQAFDLRECVEGALDLVAARAAEKGLDLAYVLGDGAPAAIVGDVTRLRQVLLNLLSNAVKFTEAGEVVLSVSARPIEGAAALCELTFSIRDTGIGIPEDRLGRLFQSFSQVDASTTRRYGGTGLGLAISQRLTELMGSRIVVTSEVGTGSDFRFTIRAMAAESPAPTRRDLSGVQPSLRGKRVLVVDDNATNRRILTVHLEAWGMLARATGSPAEALARIRADERFDIGILDMHMPEMDGVALAHAIRERPAGAAVPLVLFTSLGRREARAEEEGFAAYLHKPIKPSQLFDALATVLADRPVHVPKPGVARSELDPDMARRHPLRILLAEDNVVNQKLALRLLAQMGYRADLAADGLEAIDAVERQTYDVVLMDVQMPEMDGFEASREMNRRWPGVRRPRLVAMTANAMEGDRELCTAAGMDDYVAKPIRVEELVAVLERCRRRADEDARGAPAVAAIDWTAVERLSATMGGPFVAELIDTFAEDARELIATLRRALAETDVDAFRRAAHSLKSNGETLGATELAALARKLEAMARTGSLQGAADRIEPLVAGYEAAARALGEADVTSPRSPLAGDLLVVEDNRMNRLLLGRALEQLGHAVTFAENGLEALRILRQRAVDLILLDIEMPEMNGYQVLEALAADPRLRDLPVVMMSSVEEVDSVARCIEMGAEDYLFKPLNPILLKARIGASLEKKRLRDQQRALFRKFATAEVAEELLTTGLAVGGKHIEASVMFSDIRSFTSITEALSPADTIDLLNSYYTLMFDAIGGHGGIVNQMLGDGLMAIFGAPLPRADHRDRAVRAALEMLELVDLFNREQVVRGGVEIRIGIGIASGPVIAGLTGTAQRATYTCVGDVVNLAAHLEAHTKAVGQPILIDGNTRNGLADGIRVEAHAAAQFKTRSNTVPVYSVRPGQRP